jgi:hypothetical protein
MSAAAAVALAGYLPTTVVVTQPEQAHQAPRWTQQQERYRWRAQGRALRRFGVIPGQDGG